MSDAMTAPAPAGPGRKVVIVALNYPPSVGGAQEYWSRVAAGLAARGHSVTVITTDGLRSPLASDPGRIRPLREVVDDVEVHRHGTPRPLVVVPKVLAGFGIRLRLLGYRLLGRSVQPRVRRRLPLRAGPLSASMWFDLWRSSRRADIVVGSPAPFLTLVMPVLLRRRRGAAVVAVPFLHLGPHQLQWSSRWALRRARGVVTLTSHEANVVESMGVSRDRIEVIAPGADLGDVSPIDQGSARRRLGLPERPTVGYVGRVAAYKGVGTLLAAAPAIWSAHPEATVLVAGAATGWKEFDQLKKRAGERVVHLGSFSDEDRRYLLGACDVVVFASEAESFGIVILQAWCAGRPVVVADLAVSREVVEGAGGGQVVPIGDEIALAQAVVGYLSDSGQAERDGAAGRAAVQQNFRWDSQIERWDRLVRYGAPGGKTRT